MVNELHDKISQNFGQYSSNQAKRNDKYCISDYGETNIAVHHFTLSVTPLLPHFNII